MQFITGMIVLSLLSLLLAPTALASPLRRAVFKGPCSDPPSDFVIPTGLDALSGTPTLALVGVGVQNYTCNANSTNVNVGAVAQLYDISCLGKAQFDSIQTDAFASWSACPDTDPLGTGLTQAMQAEFNVTQTGLHYFVKQGGNNVPVWDLTGSGPFKGNKDAIVFANKTKSVPSPDGASNVAWLELVKVSGGLATKIYRLNTVSGQPASSCKPGESSSVKYTSKYVLL